MREIWPATAINDLVVETRFCSTQSSSTVFPIDTMHKLQRSQEREKHVGRIEPVCTLICQIEENRSGVFNAFRRLRQGQPTEKTLHCLIRGVS
ncbi:hypothetical protein GQ600_9450 [Phytophthora cactorum]|nr:hypothetical protein GQ600_9450 [Phytophthora cactorum]